jgi:hypothetical protein
MSTMGQYYYTIILDAEGKIVAWMNAYAYNQGVKLMEHSYLTSRYVNAVEFSLSPEGAYHKTRVVWAGDYADEEPGQAKNLNSLCDENNSKLVRPDVISATKYRYIVNHTKKQYVDKSKVRNLHPLPLLTAEGNGRGGGDLEDAPAFVGSWARDVISVEETVSTGEFQELDFVIQKKVY